MAKQVAKPRSSATTSVFVAGDIPYKKFTVDASVSNPKPLLIFTPTKEGIYPVILFCHGFYLHNDFYSNLLGHITSHGYVVVAPQFYHWKYMRGPEEIEYAAIVTNWLSQGLQPLLPQDVQADLSKLALAGHSRGGKTAFALVLGYSKSKLELNFSTLIGIDPVAGISQCCRTLPYILSDQPCSFDLSIPVAVIGTGLGPEQGSCCGPPCAPDGLNHDKFFSDCKPPCAHYVVKGYGHMDMLDDDPPTIFGRVSNCVCKNGKSPRDPMRRTVGGIVVASLKAYLDGEFGDLEAILVNPDLAPAKLDQVEFIPS